MLISNKFVLLNFPKTGSTFARHAMHQVHRRRLPGRVLERAGVLKPPVTEFRVHPYFFTQIHSATGNVSQHGTYIQIPAAHRSKPVVTVVRDPLTRIVSLYEYRDWQTRHFPNLEWLKQQFPHFPDLSFEEFVDMQQRAVPFAQPPGLQIAIGPLTTQFIRFYARDPMKTIMALREDTDLRKDYDLHFPKIHFLHTENLNQELHDLLLHFGYSPSKLAFILQKGKVNVSKRSRRSYITPQIKDTIQKSERFFYQLFPEYRSPEA